MWRRKNEDTLSAPNPKIFFCLNKFPCSLDYYCEKLSWLIESRHFYRHFKLEFLCPTTAQVETWVRKLMMLHRKRLETFPLALTSVKTSLENYFFYTSSLAFKFLHKEICPLVTQVLNVNENIRFLSWRHEFNSTYPPFLPGNGTQKGHFLVL